MPQPYLLQVFSQPHQVSPETWTQWYLEEHLRDMVYFGVVRTAALYRASSPVIIYSRSPEDGNDRRSFLAMFQTDRPKALSNPQFREKVRQTTELWGGKRGREVGELADRESELVEVVGSSDESEDAAPHLIHFTIVGNAVGDNLHPELINPVSKLDGYRRTLVYRPQQQQADANPRILLVHEFQSLHPGQLPSVQKAMEAVVKGRDYAFQLRTYELLGSEGFNGECRVPARL